MRHATRTLVVAFFLIIGGMNGCQKSPTETADQSNNTSTADHSDSADHMEHFVPPHKPASFEELVSQVMFRCETLPRLAEADEREFQKRSAELRDIIEWIPELAADSNLKRQSFETAVEHGKQLLKTFESSRDGRSLTMEAVQKNLDTLKTLVPDSIEPVPSGSIPDNSTGSPSADPK